MAVLKYYDEQTRRYKALPLGAESVAVGNFEYSEYEQVVGSWIDGRPLYRILSNSTTVSGGEVVITQDCANGMKLLHYIKSTDEPNSFRVDMLTTDSLKDEATDAEVEAIFREVNHDEVLL